MSLDRVSIHQFELGPMKNFIYLLVDKDTKSCAIIDPAWDIQVIYETIQNYNLDPVAVLLTHGHADHVNSLDPFLSSAEEYHSENFTNIYDLYQYSIINDQ